MGDVTDSIMQGELCEECCVYIDDNDQGSPRKCIDCTPNRAISDNKRIKLRAKRKRKLKAKRDAKEQGK
jgi:hypothetical protein